MAEPIKMPELGESITEGTITRWLKQEGDQVQADEPLFEVSTDKVDTEVPSPVHEDETVAVGTELAEIEPAGAKGSAAGDGQAAAAPAAAEAPAQTPAEAAEAAEAAGAEAEAGGQEPAVAEVAEEPAAAEAADAGGETVTVRMPELGESITEGTITRWLKQEGDQVQADEPL